MNTNDNEGIIIDDENDIYNENNKEIEDIDNSDLQYSDRQLYIRLNQNRQMFEERRNKLDTSEKILKSKYPELNEILTDNLMETIMESVFSEGFLTQMYIRNLTFYKSSGREEQILAIRPEKREGSFLDQYFPKGISLLFKGHRDNYEFVIDSIQETADSERLDFEVDVSARPFHTNLPMGSKDYFLRDILDEAESLTQHTEECLTEWEEYLKWRRELARRQVLGCKYYKTSVDEEKNRIVFWLICEGEEEFKGFRKYLYKDIQVFSNSYSSNDWHFELNEEKKGKKQRLSKSVELGRYKGVVESYYYNEKIEEVAEEVLEVDEDANEEGALAEDVVDTEMSENTGIDYESYYDDMDAYEDKDYDEDNSKHDREREVINEEFENPYIVKVAFELNRADMTTVTEMNADEKEITQYIYDNVLTKLDSDGFLALSAVGDFVLINRLETAINQLKRDESYSPNIALWLFDVKRARIPETSSEGTITKWLNEDILKNEGQRKAVYTMLDAPDLSLIQGPPGTGKTTVIAEAIYQFVRKGDRVLVASQSNDAVDNALDRLAATPEIRAIRLGQKGKQKRRGKDVEVSKFAEDVALKYYYQSLSKQISDRWLDRWDEIEENDVMYDRDIRDATLFQQDIEVISAKIQKLINQNEDIRIKKRDIQECVDEIRVHNENIQNEKIQLSAFEDFVLEQKETMLFLTSSQLRQVESALNPLISEMINLGINISPSVLDHNMLSIQTENELLAFIIRNMWRLKEIVVNTESATGSQDNVAEIQMLEMQQRELKDKVSIIDDDDELLEVAAQIRAIKKQIDSLKKGSSVLVLTEVESSLFSDSYRDKLNNPITLKPSIQLLDNKLSQLDTELKKSIIFLREESRKSVIHNTEELMNQLSLINSQSEVVRIELEKLTKQRDEKKNTLTTLSEKYKTESKEVEDIINEIKRRKSLNQEQRRQQSQIKGDWKGTLENFKTRLNDEESFIYDQEYYQKTYINACNVVGISCTDNMNNLTENGYNDFDVVIIDEVSKATPPELLIPLMKARKAILVGDHRQLPPMFNEHEKSYNELLKSDEEVPEEIKDLMTPESFNRFKNMVTASLFKDYFENADPSIKSSLFTQYRMHSDIMDIINRFYEQRLIAGLDKEAENKVKAHQLMLKGLDGGTFIRPDKHAYWIDSSILPSGQEFYESRPKGSTSSANILEQYMIMELLVKMDDYYKGLGYGPGNQKSVGVISFYQLQVNEIRDKFRKLNKKRKFTTISVTINTVDRFQGQEKQIIITSLVRNPRVVRKNEESHVTAFERINVAFSRAQELLIILGSRRMYENQPIKLPKMDTPGERTVYVYQNIIDTLNNKACFMSSNKLISAEVEAEILNEFNEVQGGE